MNSNASPACCAAEKMAVHFCEGPHPGDPRRRAIDSRTASAAGPSMRTICVLVSSRFDPSFFSRCAVVLPSLDSRPNCSQVPLDSANWFSDQWGPSSAIQPTLGLKRHCQLDRRHPNPIASQPIRRQRCIMRIRPSRLAQHLPSGNRAAGRRASQGHLSDNLNDCGRSMSRIKLAVSTLCCHSPCEREGQSISQEHCWFPCYECMAHSVRRSRR